MRRAFLSLVTVLLSGGCDCAPEPDVCVPERCSSHCCRENICEAVEICLFDGGGVVPTDAGATDAGSADSGTPDAGTSDAGTPDASTPDAGIPDAGIPDGGQLDAGNGDAGAGRRDGGLALSFDIPVVFPVSANGFTSYRTFLSPVDFNRDGLSDLISSASGDLSLILSSADAGLLSPISLSNRQNPCALAADFTGDGVGDLFVDDGFTQQLRRGHGDGTFDAPLTLTPYVLRACASPVRATDAGPELVVVSSSSLQRLRIVGSNLIDAGSQSVTLSGSLGPLVAADVTGDGREDLVVFSGSEAAVYTGTAVGLAAPVSTNLLCTATRALSGRFDADAFADLAVLTSCGLRVWYGSATGALVRPSQAIAVERLPIAVAAADLTGDGLSDLAVEVHGVDSNNLRQHYVAVFINQANGAFTYRERLVSPDSTYNLAIGRFDTDGVPDLYAFGVFGTWVGVGQPSTVFRIGLLFNPQERLQRAFAYGSGAGFLHVDGDGHLDAVTTLGLDGGLRLFMGDGQGRFTPGATLPTRPGFIARVSTGRFASTSAIALGLYANGQTDVLELVDGGIERTTTIPFSVGYPQGTPPTFADLNGDGVDELLFHDVSRVVLARRSGPGAFAYQLLPTPAGVGGLATADFDRDGRTDIFSWHYADRRLAVHRALADGGFADGGSVLHSNAPLLGIAGDLTGDGIADVGVTTSFDVGIATWAGSPPGFAASPSFITTLTNPSRVMLVDLDGDGRDELVVGFQQGAHVFRVPGATRIAVLPHQEGSSRFVDLNEDGLPDLIVELVEGGVAVHLNTSR